MEKSTEEILAFSKEHHIPYDLYQLLLEFHNRKQSYVSREAIIVYLSDQVVCSILYLFAKDKNSQIDYHQLVDVLFEKKLESGFFNESNLTMKEIQYMKKKTVGSMPDLNNITAAGPARPVRPPRSKGSFFDEIKV